MLGGCYRDSITKETFARREESFGEIFDEKCLKQEFIETNYDNCCKDVVDNRKEEMRHLCWEAAVGILSQKSHLQNNIINNVKS
jgi:hypothetical protein